MYKKLMRRLQMPQYTEDGNMMKDPTIGRQIAANICIEAGEAIGPGGDRENTHGPMEKSFEIAAHLISPIVGVEVTPGQVAGIMVQLKISRIITGDEKHIDHYKDIAGYAGLWGALNR
jgi:hypothetical protein